MLHNDTRFAEAVEACVTGIEARTDAELVVVAAGRSERYADVRWLGATAIAFLSLVVLIEIPAHVPPLWVIVDLVVTWLAMAWVLDADPVLKRLVSSGRKTKAVEMAAAAEFHLEAVHSTPQRTGLLVYVSALEGQVVLVRDIGLESRIPLGRWAPAQAAFRHDDLEHFLAGLEAVGDLLAEALPATDGERLDLPNAPRVRP